MVVIPEVKEPDRHAAATCVLGIYGIGVYVESSYFYGILMIRSFADRDTEGLFHGRFARRLPSDIQRVAQRKLRQTNAAEDLRDLVAPPGNRLEALKGNRAGQHSIRINDQWRICFVWSEGGAENVEIVDYHD